MPAARARPRVHGGLRASDGEAVGGDGSARRSAARQPQPFRQLAKVGEARQEADQEDAQFRGANCFDHGGFAAPGGACNVRQIGAELAAEYHRDVPPCRQRRLSGRRLCRLQKLRDQDFPIQQQWIEMHRQRAVGGHHVAYALQLHGSQGIARRHDFCIERLIDAVPEFERQRAVTESEDAWFHPTMRCGSQVMMAGKA